MTDQGGPSRATPEGQMLAFVQGLTALRGRRRAAARIFVAIVLLLAAVALTFGAVWAYAGALQ